MISKIKKLSPALVNLILLLSIQLVILVAGWHNNWWTKESSNNSGDLSKVYTELNQQLIEIDNLPNSTEKSLKIQKFTYQLIVGPLSQNDEIDSSKQWQELKDFWNKNGLNEVSESNVDQKITRLTNAISNFGNYTEEKKYPTLGRVTSRMKARDISSIDAKSQEAALFAFVKDIEFMQATVRTANIDEAAKTETSAKMNDLLTIIADLQIDIKKSQQTQLIARNLFNKVKSVLLIAKPIIVQSNVTNGKVFHGLFFAFISIFLTSAILGLWILINELSTKQKNKKTFENNFLVLLNESFVKGDVISTNKFSTGFQSTFFQIHNFIQKKMHYGQMFQDTIPFPTILIDSNLQVRWFNQSLVSEWHLEDFIRERESLSWEHFSQLTNMSTSDPVMDVIRNRHAGIFKLQVKPLNSENAVPYQMYVTPYQIGEEKLCLLFFYPLLSLEETIDMQTQAIVGPVRNTLNAMLEKRYDSKFMEHSKSDYEIGSIEDVHRLFDLLYSKNSNASEELLVQLNDRDSKIQDQQQVIHSFDGDIEQLKRLQAEMKQSMQDLKGSIIKSFENVDLLKLGNEEVFQKLKLHWEKFIHLQNGAEKLFSVYQCTREQVQQMIQLKASTKDVREAIQGHKSNATKVIKAMSAFIDKQNQNRSPIYNTWNSTINELAKLPDFLTSLDKYIQHTEMSLGKVVLRIEDSYKAIEDIKIEQSNANVLNMLASFSNNFGEIEEIKERLIESFKEIYVLMQQQVKVTSQSHGHLYSNIDSANNLLDKELH